MGRPRKTQSMSDGKKEIIARLIDEYDIKSTADIQEALRDLLGETIQGMMESEMETQKAERQTEDPAHRDSRNGYKPKTLRSNYGPVEIQVPQDRNSDYEPQIVPKYRLFMWFSVSARKGHKEVLSITIGENESAKFWLSCAE